MRFIRFQATVALAGFCHGLPAQESAFQDLFNGRDLSGWINVNCAMETWTAKNGVIHCTGKPTGALRTERQYENFVLELEWRHMRPGGNAGVFLWAGPIAAPGVPFLRAIEVQVLDHGYNASGKNKWYTTHGDVFPIHGSTMKPHGRHNGMRSFPSNQRSKGSPEWNHYRIDCRDGVLKLSVNGQKVSGGSECNWRKGYIALESEGSPVEFRNIRIRELSPGMPSPALAAPLAVGFRPLYNGLDLRGWDSSSNDDRNWKAADWKLNYTPAEKEKGVVLWSGEKRNDFELIVDVQLPKNTNLNRSSLGGICLLGNPEPAILLGTGQAPVVIGSQRLKADSWHRLQIKVRNRQLDVSLNGQSMARAVHIPAGTGRETTAVGLAGFAQPFSLSNLYFKSP